jgi:hypothetical protein
MDTNALLASAFWALTWNLGLRHAFLQNKKQRKILKDQKTTTSSKVRSYPRNTGKIGPD